MAKIDLPTISSGYASNTTFNTTFTTIENEFQQKVLYRDNPDGEPNSMQNDPDMNSNDINNVKDITMTGDFTVDGVDYLEQMQTLYDNYLALVDRVTISTDSPSGGTDGDIWFKVT